MSGFRHFRCIACVDLGDSFGDTMHRQIPRVRSRAYVYELFLVAYQDYRNFALNLSAALEIEDPIGSDEDTETAGEFAIGIIRKAEIVVPLLEFQVEVASGETPVLVAPGLYLTSLIGPFDVAFSIPIGLNDDAAGFAVFFLAVLEF